MNDKFKERCQKVIDIANRRNNAYVNEINRLNESIKNLEKQIQAKMNNISMVLKLAKLCIDNDIDIDRFVSNSLSDCIGFYGSCVGEDKYFLNKRKYYKNDLTLAIYGNAKRYDLLLAYPDNKTLLSYTPIKIMVWGDSKHNEEIEMLENKIKALTKFVNEFDDFESRFYNYIDMLEE